MKFSELDQQMRVFETAHDLSVLPGLYMIARLDGRGFTRLTKEVLDLERPFDERFRDAMAATAQHLMQVGLRVVYACTHSDEISLLFHPEEAAFGRKLRKFNSVLAGEASAAFTQAVGHVAAFDSRISQLPTTERVVDYFRWRSADAKRNALSAHCYYALRREGVSPHVATERLSGVSVAGKNELLFQRGINFNDLPAWQKRSAGLWWQDAEMEGYNPMTGEATRTTRRRIYVELDLPVGEAYGDWLCHHLASLQ